MDNFNPIMNLKKDTKEIIRDKFWLNESSKS